MQEEPSSTNVASTGPSEAIPMPTPDGSRDAGAPAPSPSISPTPSTSSPAPPPRLHFPTDEARGPSNANASRTATPSTAPRPSRRPRPLPRAELERLRRFRLDTPKGRVLNRGVAVVLVLVGLSVALADNASPEYQVTMLATSGSFFALAEAQNSLYSASSNGGSILLEKSSDRGLTWTANPVPYSAVAGGAPWDLSVVAADGSDMVLTAASGLTTYGSTGYSSPPCNQNSTILLASSQDGGASWSSSTLIETPGAVVTSLQAGVENGQAAVAWIQQPVGPCGETFGEVSAVTSRDAGQHWSQVQNLTLGNASLSSEESLEMAPESQGIILAFLEKPVGASSTSLGLWLNAAGSGEGFGAQPFKLITPPTSWTLQGDPMTPAVLITPTYLIPLTGSTNDSFTAIPFNQLQADGGAPGALPNLVSLVPLGPTSVEIAATMPQGSGVDCWIIDLLASTVTQSCHVPLGALLVPASQQFPIVALLDGGGYWIAIGASGAPTCFDVCPQSTQNAGGQPTGPSPSAPSGASAGVSGGAAVGTSVCIEGCSSDQGLAAYAFTESAPLSPALVSALSALVVVAGIAWLARTRRARRRMDSARPATETLSNSAGPVAGTEPKRILNAYRRGLEVWALAWVPLALLGFVPSSTGSFAAVPWVALAMGVVGALVAMPFHAMVRRSLQNVYGVHPERLFTEDPHTVGATQDKVRLAALFAYLSWVAGAVMLLLVGLAALGAIARVDATYGTLGSSAQLGSGAYLLLASILSVVLFRLLYHVELSDSVALLRAQMTTGSEETPLDPGSVLRGRLGASLLVMNPLVGLLLGWSIQPVLPVAASVLPWVFLPVTLVGAALLHGMFGASTWSPERVTAPVAE